MLSICFVCHLVVFGFVLIMVWLLGLACFLVYRKHGVICVCVFLLVFSDGFGDICWVLLAFLLQGKAECFVSVVFFFF